MLDLGSNKQNRDSYIQTLFNLWLQTETGDHRLFRIRSSVFTSVLNEDKMLIGRNFCTITVFYWIFEIEIWKVWKKMIISSEKALSWVNFLFSFYLSRCLYKGCSNYLTRLNYNCMYDKHINNKNFTVVGLFGSFYEFSCEFEI